MPAPAVIQGTFADLKSVKTRGVVQLVVEVPIEHAAKIVEAFGFPQPGHEIPVAVARLVEGKAGKQTAAPKAIEGPSRRWSELSRAQQAGIRCGEPPFWRFLQDLGYRPGDDEWHADYAACAVRDVCSVGSRKEFDRSQEAAAAWDRLDGTFQAWMLNPDMSPSDLKRSTGEAA